VRGLSGNAHRETLFVREVLVPPKRSWSLLTNHGLALLCIARDRSVRMRDLAAHVGITERSAQSIVADLIASGHITRQRHGRRNRYELRVEQPLELPTAARTTLGEALEPFV
jgi:DNA-binding MarR family transcriptional regulator